MKRWCDVPFADLLVESRDGEWGKGEPEVGHTEAVVIRGTDFAGVNDPEQSLPHRWIKNHLVERKKLRPGDIVFEMAGGTSTQSTGRSALLKPGLSSTTHLFLRYVPASVATYVSTFRGSAQSSFTIFFKACIAPATWVYFTFNIPE
ncbi:MAG: hypothetical protein GXP09_00480 [Gammaproteobacteria bacterium]|nr:hypothetical protein [Gammaproteobacteria bacterium]